MPSAEEIERIEQEVNADLPEMMERVRRQLVARDEPSVSGQLRRAIHESRLLYPTLSRLSGVSMQELDDFMAGEPVSSKVFDRLAAAMKYQLMPAG